MSRNRPCIKMASEDLNFGRIGKPHPILFLNPIIAFVLVVLVGIESGLAKSESDSRLQFNQKRSTRAFFMAKYKRLSTRQKLRLYNVMIRTMAVLEHAYYRRSENSSSASYFFNLFLQMAYAQSSSGNSCFYGGHIIRDCNWSQAKRDYNTCLVNGVKGIQCNSSILLNEGICVYAIEHARREGLRNYSTTQACVYADTQITAQRLAGRSPPLTNDQVVRSQLNSQFWGSGDPDVWYRKRNEILTDALGGEGVNLYQEHLNSRLGDGSRIRSQLAAIDKICTNVRKPFEVKHCQFFRRELAELGLKERPNPLPQPRAPKPTVTTTTTTTTSTTGPTLSQACDKVSHCNEGEIKEGNVCIIESGMHELRGQSREYSDNYVANYTCPNQEGVDTLTYFIAEDDQDDINGILKKLDEVAQRCTKIKRLYLSGHGAPGALANGLNRNNVSRLEPYSCLMADDPIVDLAGCSAGKGCSGKLFMQKAAEALFHNTTGTVIAPNVDTLFRVELGAYTEERLAYNSLTFTPPPPEPPPSTWKKIGNRERISYQQGIMEGIIQEQQQDEHATIEDQCIDDMSKMINQVHSNEELHRSEETCEPLIECSRQPYTSVTSSARRKISFLENSRSRDRYTRRYFLNSVADNYDNLKRINRKLVQCDRTCTRRNGRRECERIGYRRGHTPKTGCRLGDYFLPYPGRQTRSLRNSGSQGLPQ